MKIWLPSSRLGVVIGESLRNQRAGVMVAILCLLGVIAMDTSHRGR